MFKRFAVIGFSYFSLLVVLLSLLKVNVANAGTNEYSSTHKLKKNYSYNLTSFQQKSPLFDFSELLLLFEDGEELNESDNEQEALTHLVFPFFDQRQEFYLQLTIATSIEVQNMNSSKAVQFTFPRLHIKNCVFRI